MFVSDFKAGLLRRSCFRVHQVHDGSLVFTNDSGVRFGNKVAYGCRVPVVSASHAGLIVQTLLDYHPLAARRHHETVKIDLETVCNSIVIDARSQPAGTNQRVSIEPVTPGNFTKLVWRAPGKPASTAANVKSELISLPRQSAFERTHH